MQGLKIKITREQLKYIMHMLEVTDPNAAVEQFAKMLVSEKVPVDDLPLYIDKIMKRKND